MKKLLLTLFILSATITACLAQKDQSLDMGLTSGLPIGTYSNPYSYSLGFFATYEVPSKVKDLEYLISASYIHINPKSVPYNPKKPGPVEADFFPIDVGLKYFIGHFYLAGQAGVSPNINSQYKGPFLGLDAEPSIGYTIRVFDLDEVDFGVAYDARVATSGNTINLALVHFAYRFDL